ncbi:MAG: 2Fe-2S iron-sulfur cluster binding domain-containing protein [Bacteroidia bacterium]|nr:2Fe-2S iron-sulfur cluster binding domain-containing protein [Bacteroidia bacterium]
MKFYPLKVSDVNPETGDCVSVGFEVPANLKKEFSHIQGQYLSLRFMLNGEELRRSYSICTSPFEPGLRIAVKKVKDGRVSTYINEQLKAGDIVESMVPIGSFFTEVHQYNKKVYNLFAAGSGITPIISILKTMLAGESQSKVNLFYGNSNERKVIFKDELNGLERKYGDRLKIIYLYSQPEQAVDELHKGRLTKEKIKRLTEKYIELNLLNEFFVCGPADVMLNTKEALEDLNVAKNKIHLEYFGTPPDADKNKLNQSLIVPSEVTIICDGDERVVFLEPHQSVLEAALEANLDAPYSCRAGSCCTCRAKVIEGKVIMDVNYALLDSEVEEGYILTCQSHAITPTLTVDYDHGK